MSLLSEVNPLIINEDDRYEVSYQKANQTIIAKAPNLDDAKALFEWAAVRVKMITAS